MSLRSHDVVVELQRVKEKNVELRRQQERLSKELAVTKQQLDTTRSQLHAAEVARCTTQQYVQNMELRLEQNGKSPAAIKASRLQSNVKWLEKENSVLYGDLQVKVHEAERLKQELHRQRKLVDETAACLGLPTAVLDELHELRAHVIQLSDNLADKEDAMKRHATDNKDVHVFRDHCNTLMSRTAELEKRMEASEAQCADLLDFIEEKQSMETALVQERDAAQLAAKSLAQDLSRAQEAARELQSVLHRTQADSSAVQAEVSAMKVDKADTRRQITELQVQIAASQKQLDFVERELRVLLRSLQETLGGMARHEGHASDAVLQKAMQTLSGATSKRASEAVALLALVSQNLRVLLSGHADLQRAADHHKYLAQQNTQLWDQVSTLVPQHEHAKALVSDLQAQVSASAANWKDLISQLISHYDPSNSHACIAGREYEAASAVMAHIRRVSHARDQSQEQVLQLDGRVAALRRELTECQGELAEARKNCAQRPRPEEWEEVVQKQHVAMSQVLELTDRATAAEAQARLCSVQLAEAQSMLQSADQQIKALQEVVGEQRQELLTLHAFRASVVMRKGGCGDTLGSPGREPACPASSPSLLPTSHPARRDITQPGLRDHRAHCASPGQHMSHHPQPPVLQQADFPGHSSSSASSAAPSPAHPFSQPHCGSSSARSTCAKKEALALFSGKPASSSQHPADHLTSRLVPPHEQFSAFVSSSDDDDDDEEEEEEEDAASKSLHPPPWAPRSHTPAGSKGLPREQQLRQKKHTRKTVPDWMFKVMQLQGF